MHWFICKNENTEGPFESDQVKQLVEQGQVPLDSLIWGRGMESWTTVTQWMNGNFASREQTKSAEPMWHYAREGVSRGPMTRAEMIYELSNIRDKDLILVWTKGMKAWADLYEFPDLIQALGMNRREHPRAPIKGSVMIRQGEVATLCQLRTIGPGGIGASGAPKDLRMGDPVQLDISAPTLGENISVKATVQYTTELGYIGIKFEGMNQEARSKIIEHVNEYTKEETPQTKAA